MCVGGGEGGGAAYSSWVIGCVVGGGDALSCK